MKFMKFGKALLISALSAGVIFSITSCVQSYTVGYLYVTGTVTSDSSGNGYVAGFKIDHNTGKLTPIDGLNPPTPSGGANPVRAVLSTGSRFLYVLNQGATASGTADCTTADPCLNSNITEFAVGANGIVTSQETFYTQGVNPTRMLIDGSGNYLMVLDHDAPAYTYCGAALTGATTCGDITVFQINQVTGRLSVIQNAQVNSADNVNIAYFPVPANPIDFTLSGGIVLTLTGTPGTGDTVYPYAYNSTNGQLTVTSNSSDSIGNVDNATAIVVGGSYIWVLDNDPITLAANGATTTYPSQMLPWNLGTNGSLTAAVSGPIPDDPNQSNPIYLVEESKARWFYVANQGIPAPSTLPLSGIAGYVVNTPFQPTEISPSLPFGAGAGPVCLVEDPSDQFFYTANHDAATVTGQVLDQNAGVLTPLSQSSKAPSSYPLTGQPSWCLVDGRT